MELIRGLCGPALRHLYFRFLSDDETFGSTRFFKPVRDFVKRMNVYCPQVNLETCPIAHVKSLLRDAIYKELNVQWKSYDYADTSHNIYPV